MLKYIVLHSRAVFFIPLSAGFVSCFYSLQSYFIFAGGFPRQQSPTLAPFSSEGNNGNGGQTLLSAMAQAIGARAGVSPELLGHFVRAGGGDVGKAASLYLAMADEFVELRAMARYLVLVFWCILSAMRVGVVGKRMDGL